MAIGKLTKKGTSIFTQDDKNVTLKAKHTGKVILKGKVNGVGTAVVHMVRTSVRTERTNVSTKDNGVDRAYSESLVLSIHQNETRRDRQDTCVSSLSRLPLLGLTSKLTMPPEFCKTVQITSMRRPNTRDDRAANSRSLPPLHPVSKSLSGTAYSPMYLALSGQSKSLSQCRELRHEKPQRG